MLADTAMDRHHAEQTKLEVKRMTPPPASAYSPARPANHTTHHDDPDILGIDNDPLAMAARASGRMPAVVARSSPPLSQPTRDNDAFKAEVDRLVTEAIAKVRHCTG